MGIIAKIFRDHGAEYVEKFRGHMPAGHQKVIGAICSCRTKDAGVNYSYCLECGEIHTVFRCCGNRHCPNCQHSKSQEWLHKRLQRQLPGPHFMLTFTVPAQLRSFFRSNQKITYEALFKTSSQALKTLIAKKKYVGGDLPGFFGVLHTWGRQISYHPHIHYVVPGGAINRKTKLWMPSKEDFLVHVKPLSELFRNTFKQAMKEAGVLEEIDPKVWQKKWVVNSQAVGQNAEGALKYLAPYVFRVAISDSRIVKVTERSVTFRYIDSKTQQSKVMTLEVLEFMRRFLQHVLPKGFQKVRYYGFMGSGCKIPHEEISAMVQLCMNFECKVPEPPQESLKKHSCPSCGGRLVLLESVLADGTRVRVTSNST